MKLFIFHYHFRPGGVRRVIELALPHLVRGLRPRIDSVVFVGGESPDLHWEEELTKSVSGIQLEFQTYPALGYYSEITLPPTEISAETRKAVRNVLHDSGQENCLVWAHNLGLARNPLLTQAIIEETAALGITLIAHHHDWWFDNRWQRWPELNQAGFCSLEKVASLVIPTKPNIHHVAINQKDFAPLQNHFGGRAHWLPNPIETPPQPDAARVRNAKTWLNLQLGDEAPVWLFPCRLLRRKNIAEALLLTCWLRPEAWLVTTGGVSSADERDYAQTLADAAQNHGWRLRLGILHGDESQKPTLPELLAASEAVILTSIQEGFGLPCLEAAAAGRPLIARSLPNVSPDLAKFGFRFPQEYDEILIDPGLFDWVAEQLRQRERFRDWKAGLTRECRTLLGKPIAIAEENHPAPVPFSRLTLTAQLEVLAQAPSRSWELCAPLNSYLINWRHAAGKAQLKSTPWPADVGHWLSGDAYARRFQEIVLSKTASDLGPNASCAVQDEFLQDRLGSHNLFPLLWNTKP